MAVTIVETRAITGGVDTHAGTHVAAALDPIGGGLARRSTTTSCRSTGSWASLEADDRPSSTSQPQSRTKTK
jgi:hypothetical protein